MKDINVMYKSTGLKEELIAEIVEYAKKHKVEKLFLFGSRARGDYKERSDIDLAFYGGNENRFPLDLEEETQTLLFYDVVNLKGIVSKELMDSINRDGVLLYEKI